MKTFNVTLSNNKTKTTKTITVIDQMTLTNSNITIIDNILSFLPNSESSPIESFSNTVSISPRSSLRLALQAHQELGSGWKNHSRYSLRLALKSSDSSVSASASSAASVSLPPPSNSKSKSKSKPRSQSRKRAASKKATSCPRFVRTACAAVTAKFQKLLCCRRHKEFRKRFTKNQERRQKFKNYEFGKALETYTTNEYRKINEALRSGTVDSQEEGLQKTIKDAIMAFKIGLRWGELKVCNSKKTLFRGSGSLPFVPQVGATMSDEGFYSTSLHKSIAVDFLTKQKADEARYLFVVMSHCNGVNVKQFSRCKKEEEVLFAPSTLFRIASVAPGHIEAGVEGTITRVELHEMV
ncbi:unnamed protein product [Cylindrotheca closterium]|uniref:NAD(P)(+)--arginine ADP-ribosyltransferase n=1 Tax=Cylindrotheca closterium TaxID=2856 RepID=A0AAD2FT05_9STRA|nr:unnamed protein product [Cylindrotheca closterium]